MASMTPKIPVHHTHIRPYARTDHAQIVEMCRDVYGGTDRLPALLHTPPPHVSVLVMHADGRQDAVEGVGAPPAILLYMACKMLTHFHAACLEQRGEQVLWLFGLRVAKPARNRGVAKRLVVRSSAPLPAMIGPASPPPWFRLPATLLPSSKACHCGVPPSPPTPPCTMYFPTAGRNKRHPLTFGYIGAMLTEGLVSRVTWSTWVGSGAATWMHCRPHCTGYTLLPTAGCAIGCHTFTPCTQLRRHQKLLYGGWRCVGQLQTVQRWCISSKYDCASHTTTTTTTSQEGCVWLWHAAEGVQAVMVAAPSWELADAQELAVGVCVFVFLRVGTSTPPQQPLHRCSVWQCRGSCGGGAACGSAGPGAHVDVCVQHRVVVATIQCVDCQYLRRVAVFLDDAITIVVIGKASGLRSV